MSINPDATIKTIERFQAAESLFYGIYFSAEKIGPNSPYGHAFVAFHHGKETPIFQKSESFGLYPGSSEKNWTANFGLDNITGGQGAFSDFEEKTDLALHVFVSSSTFSNTLTKAREFASNPPKWALITMDTCVTMLKPLAALAGLSTPSVLVNPYPEEWVKKLMSLND